MYMLHMMKAIIAIRFFNYEWEMVYLGIIWTDFFQVWKQYWVNAFRCLWGPRFLLLLSYYFPVFMITMTKNYWFARTMKKISQDLEGTTFVMSRSQGSLGEILREKKSLLLHWNHEKIKVISQENNFCCGEIWSRKCSHKKLQSRSI